MSLASFNCGERKEPASIQSSRDKTEPIGILNRYTLVDFDENGYVDQINLHPYGRSGTKNDLVEYVDTTVHNIKGSFLSRNGRPLPMDSTLIKIATKIKKDAQGFEGLLKNLDYQNYIKKQTIK